MSSSSNSNGQLVNALDARAQRYHNRALGQVLPNTHTGKRTHSKNQGTDQENQEPRQKRPTPDASQPGPSNRGTPEAPIVAADFTKAVIIVSADQKFKQEVESDRVQVIERFEAQIPQDCQEEGSWSRQGAEYPGIPSRKLCKVDIEANGVVGEGVVQAAYEIHNTPSQALVLHQGRTCLTMSSAHTAKISSALRDILALKNRFLDTLKRTIGRDLINREKYLNKEILENPDHPFWMYQDLSFFHTMAAGFSIMYMCLKDQIVAPPRFSYTPVNMFTKSAYNVWKNNAANKRFDELKKVSIRGSKKATVCENPSGCVCNQRFAALYDDKATQFLYKADGLLNLKDYNPAVSRLVMECSDACGCSINCPNRQLQRGRNKALVVYHEDELRGFGLRAAEPIKKGELITHYAGVIHTISKEDHKNRQISYDAELTMFSKRLVIASDTVGNVARFLGHACSPSAVFMETYSRKSEMEIVVPQIGIYALKDIKIGEAVSISYWKKDDLREKKGVKQVKCGCKVGCKSWIKV
ncbi:hypothetical protein CRE_17327 [Caenorhabditis remanei]|uniref:SET domain-containing protein n=1 Tax=Caenorhabditis remanei TaxID=31234 RepID=E3MRX7_CAERE|nr:hypothetical protein CRE_17327 [Caenorhabditis remanei]